MRALVLFRNDLRVHDNEALLHAAKDADELRGMLRWSHEHRQGEDAQLQGPHVVDRLHPVRFGQA